MGLTHSPKIVTDGLVLCYDAANARSYPGTGTTWTDLTNKGSIVFDGTNDRVAISLGSLPTPQNSSNFTYEAVVKFDSLGWRTIFSQNPGPIPNGGILVGVHGTNSKLFTVMAGSLQQPSFAAVSTNTIYHVAFGVSGTNIYIGLNGVWDSVNTASFSNTGTGDINIGTEPSSGGGFLDGGVYLVRVYNQFLSDDKLLENYNALKARFK
jgi:hypothetical protein